MGVLLLGIVFLGFGSAMLVGQVFIAWFILFILQTRLVSTKNFQLHKRLGYSSIALVAAMLVTGFLMSATSFTRGTSPIPDTTIQQFMSLPLLDLTGLVIFVTLGILNRSKADLHKHCMLMASIAIMDPALARFTMSLGVPPLAILLHIVLVVMVIVYDKRNAGTVNIITWLGLVFVVLRTVFIFTIASTPNWAVLMNALYS